LFAFGLIERMPEASQLVAGALSEATPPVTAPKNAHPGRDGRPLFGENPASSEASKPTFPPVREPDHGDGFDLSSRAPASADGSRPIPAR